MAVNQETNPIKQLIDHAGLNHTPPTAPAIPPLAIEKPNHYGIENGCIYRLDKSKKVALCNFIAYIIEERTRDNGQTQEKYLVIKGELENGTQLRAIEVPASAFESLNWVTANWGTAAIIYTSLSVRDHLRTAIQELSKGQTSQTVIYTHTGWRFLDNAWYFLHKDGAIGPEGHRQDIEVLPGEGPMALYCLPQPQENQEQLKHAVLESLNLQNLAPNRPEIGLLLLLAAYRAPLAECLPIDHSIWLSGASGVFKTEAVSLALAHFGTFTSRTLPANFTDSEGSLEQKAHAAKDVIFIVDDFKPVGGKNEINSLHAKADRLCRGAGNQAGRSTLTRDREQRSAAYPRGMVMVTGEDLPNGHSLRARLTVLEITKGDIDKIQLKALQESANHGHLRVAMAGYIHWLANNMEHWKQEARNLYINFRDQFLAQAAENSTHARTASDYGSSMLALHLITEFIKDRQILTNQDADQFRNNARQTLLKLMQGQTDNQMEEDEGQRFLSLLKSALSAGHGHVRHKETLKAPQDTPELWGWKQGPSNPIHDPFDQYYQAQGPCIGWVLNQTLYLNGESTFAVIQKFAIAQGNPITLTRSTLWKRLEEKGSLDTEQFEKGRKQACLRIKHKTQRAYPLKLEVFDEI